MFLHRSDMTKKSKWLLIDMNLNWYSSEITTQEPQLRNHEWRMTQLRNYATQEWLNSGMTRPRNDTIQTTIKKITQKPHDSLTTWLRKTLKKHSVFTFRNVMIKKNNSEWYFLELGWPKLNDFKRMTWLSNEATWMTWRRDDLNVMT